jgi:hypothetical protein
VDAEVKEYTKFLEYLLPFWPEFFVSCLLSECVKMRMYKSVKLPVVLCGSENFFLKLREGHRLRVFEDGSLRRIFGPKREK